MSEICQIYLPQFAQTFGRDSLKVLSASVDVLKEEWDGIYLIGLWKSGGADNGFDVVDYTVNPEFGTDDDLDMLIFISSVYGFKTGVDVVPNHVSDRHELAQNCLKGVPGYGDVLYVVTGKEAARLAASGVPSFFGCEPYSEVEGFKAQDKFVRNTFCDGRQLNLNWDSPVVKEYFRNLFRSLKNRGVNFVRTDCSILLYEDVTKADPNNPLACINAERSVKALRDVAGDMPLYHEWFGGPFSPDILDDDPLSLALDCSYVIFGKQPVEWRHPNLVPVIGGHDQMPLLNRAKLQGFDPDVVLQAAHAAPSGVVFSDLATRYHYAIPDGEMEPTEKDKQFDADINNPNRRYLGRRELPRLIYEKAGIRMI